MIYQSPAVSRRALLAGAIAVPAAGVLAGCGGDDEPSDGDSAAVTVLTGFRQQPWESYLDLAMDRNHFADEGLNVTVKPGGGTGENMSLLAGGQTDIATLDVPTAMIAHSNAADADFALISLLHHGLMAGIVSLASSQIAHPRDLAGGTLAVIPGGVNAVLFPAVAEEAGLDPESVEQVSGDPSQFNAQLAGGAVDATVAFVPELPAVERAVGQPINVIAYRDWLPDAMGSSLAVTREFADRAPDLLRRFNRAALQGLQGVKDDPEEAGRVWWRRHGQVPDWEEATAIEACVAFADYIQAAQGKELGEFDESRVSRLVALLKTLGSVDDSYDQDALVRYDLAR